MVLWIFVNPNAEWYINLRNVVDRTSFYCLINFCFRISWQRNNPCSSINWFYGKNTFDFINKYGRLLTFWTTLNWTYRSSIESFELCSSLHAPAPYQKNSRRKWKNPNVFELKLTEMTKMCNGEKLNDQNKSNFN
jgi:hypothetical protein